MAMEPEGTLITLQDENGKEHEFEHIATIEHEGSSYVGLVPATDSPEDMLGGDGELVILKIVTDEDGEELLAAIEDDDEFEAVAQKFEDLLDEEYDILYEDEENDEDGNEGND